MTRLGIVDEEGDFPDCSSLLQALQRWENEGSAALDRLPASLISREGRPDFRAPGPSGRSSVSSP